MLKYQKKGLYKLLSMLLAVAMLLTAPIGTMQAYALEGEQPTVTDIQGELPLGMSEEAGPGEVSDSGTHSEKLASPTDVSPLGADAVCKIGEDEYDTLETALASVGTKEAKTISLLKNAFIDNGIVIDDKTVTFAIGGNSLSVVGTPALVAKNGGRALFSGTMCNLLGGVIAEAGSLIDLVSGSVQAGETVLHADGGTIVTAGNVIALSGTKNGALAEKGGKIIIGGNVDCSVGNSANQTGALATGADSTITVIGNIVTNPANTNAYGACAEDGGQVIVDGTITADANRYIKVDGAVKAKRGHDAVSSKAGYLAYTGEHGSVVWVKDTAAPSETFVVSSTVELQSALTQATDGDIIQLNTDIVYNTTAVIIVQGKNIILDMNDHNLTISNNGTGAGLRLEIPASNERNATQVHVIGSGDLKISSTTPALSIDASRFTSAATVNVELLSRSGAGIGGTLADVDIQNGSVTGSNGILLSHNSNVTVKGSIKATGDTGIKLAPSKLYPEDPGCVVHVDSIEANKCGIFLDGGNVTVDGTITAPAYIQFKALDEVVATAAIGDYLADTTKIGYHTYHHATVGTVWVKGVAVPTEKVCAIGGTQYATLDEALGAVKNGETIKLLQNITHTTPMEVREKTIIFDLEDYNLLLDTSTDTAYNPALRVADGGKVKLTGTGKFNIKGASSGLIINGLNAEATVDNVEVMDAGGRGVYMSGFGGALESNSIVTVKGNIKADSGDGVEINAKNGKVTVKGNITAGSTGVKAWSNPGTEVTVNGNITVSGPAPDHYGVQAYGSTTKVTVGGNVTVEGAGCLGVYASGSTVNVAGKVTAAGVGVLAENENGNIIVHDTIEGVECGAKSKSGGTITAQKGVSATGIDGVGAWITDTGSITIEGEITAKNYIKLADQVMPKNAGVADPLKAGYIKYSDYGGRMIWVKATSSQVGKTFTQINEGVPFLYKILTDEPGRSTVEVMFDSGYTGQTALIVPERVTNEGTTYSVTSIGKNAFYNCKKATSIRLPQSVTNIGAGAFNGCQVLEGFTIPPFVNKIGTDAFAYCAKLTSIIIPSGVTNIEARTFRACGLTSINIPNGVTSIGESAFDACGLLTSITIPQSVISIGGAAFSFCGSLNNVHIPNGVTNIEEETFRDCKSLTKITIPVGVREIGKSAFMGCESLTEIKIPAGVTAIGDSAFAGCKGLAEFQIPTGITSIGEYVFSGCKGLAAITIPVGVTSIGDSAFSGCTTLKNVTFLRLNPPNFYSNFPSSVTTIYVPLGAIAQYQLYTEEGYPLAGAQIIELGAYNLTVSGSYAGTTGAGSYGQGATVTINAGTRSGYGFAGWTSPDGVTFANSGSATTTFTMPAKNVTITAAWSYNGGGSGSGGGSSSNDNSSPVIVTPPAPDKPNSPTQGEIKVPGTVDGKGNVTVNLTDKTVTDAFDKALAEAKKNGTEQNGITVVLRVDTGNKTGSNVTVNLPKAVQDTIIAKKIVSIIVVVDNPDIRVGMDLATVKEINKQAKSDVNITATRTDSGKLPGDAKKAIGSRPVFDLKVNYGNGKAVSSFGAGSVSVTIPYTLGANEKAGNVQAVYVDSKGKVHWLVNSVYDSVEKVLRFSTDHFSTYGIGYKQANTAFTDIAGHWAKEDIAFVVNRGLFSGTSAKTFSPNTAMTRGMFVTALGRLANADVSTFKQSSFSDVKNDAYYMGYIEWASKNSIVNGVGNKKFAPDQSITREQMAVIMSNYAKTIGFTLPKVHLESTFADNAKISAYAKNAVKQMQMAGVISGKNGNLFDPQCTATRAEVSAVLRRFVELAISSDTVQGWTMNDSGKWMYFEDGKPITGKKDIVGSTYTFDKHGVTADVPKNLRYTIYTVQKGDSFWLIAHKLGCTMSELERLNNKSRFSLIHPGDVLRVPERME